MRARDIKRAGLTVFHPRRLLRWWGRNGREKRYAAYGYAAFNSRALHQCPKMEWASSGTPPFCNGYKPSRTNPRVFLHSARDGCGRPPADHRQRRAMIWSEPCTLAERRRTTQGLFRRLMAYSDAPTAYYYAMKKFKRPNIDNFRHYCYECAHWTFIRDIGCAHEGVCMAIEGEPTEQDAYDKMCGLFTAAGGHNVPENA